MAYVNNGQPNKAIELVNQLEQKTKESDSRSINYSLGLYYASAGELDDALYWLESAYESHDTELYGLKISPFFKPLHGHPRYEELLKKIGFPE